MAFEVTLHVYDLSGGIAKQCSQKIAGVHVEGLWQTGIVVHDKEYYFPGSSISADNPSCTPYGKPVKSILLGKTEVHEDMFLELLKDALCDQF
jgi:hypothetical protein